MNQVCRACRNTVGPGEIALAGISTRCHRALWEMMYECTQLKVTLDDTLPKNICASCLERLEVCFEFVTMCRASADSFLATEMPIKCETLDLTETILIKEEPLFETAGEQASFEMRKLEQITSDDDSLLTMITTTDGMTPGPEPGVTGRRHYARLRMQRTRANYTTERVTNERILNRLRVARKRAARTQEQIELDRERNRVRQFLRRANRTSEEIEAQRERGRLQNAARRAAMRKAERSGTDADASS
uniref:(northern house mosquito) hypothetical protein n=1 Tax=Culex pipiens TaxID=7175 RepID=A0A8D8CUP6_CULPI